MSSLQRYVEPELAELLLVVTGIASETDALPIREVGQHWRLGALARKEREIAEAQQYYCGTAMEAARRVACFRVTPT